MAHFPETEKTLDLFTHNPVLLIKNFPVFTDSLLSNGCHDDSLSSLVLCPWLQEPREKCRQEKSRELVLLCSVNWIDCEHSYVVFAFRYSFEALNK